MRCERSLLTVVEPLLDFVVPRMGVDGLSCGWWGWRWLLGRFTMGVAAAVDVVAP